MIDNTKKIAIVGFASSSRMLAPYQDPNWYIAGMNSLYALLPPMQTERMLWYEMHTKEHFSKDLNRTELKQIGVDHLEWLRKVPKEGEKGHFPIFTQEQFPDIPASVKWPREEINCWTIEKFGPDAELDYFTSTPGLMMAHAIFMGFKEIGLFGVDLLQDQEYAYQRPGCEYWIGIARGMGIKVHVPKSSCLLKANYVYGYSEPQTDEKTVKPLVTFFEGQDKKVESEQHRVAGDTNGCIGAVNAYTVLKKKLEELLPKNPPLIDDPLKEMEAKLPGASVVDMSLMEFRDRIEKFADEEIKRLGDIVSSGKLALERMNAIREAFISAATYTAAYGRGDKLEGM